MKNNGHANIERSERSKEYNQYTPYQRAEVVKVYLFRSLSNRDLDVARPILTTMHKMHRTGVDNYVTTNGSLRKLTLRECLRLMGFSDDWKIVV